MATAMEKFDFKGNDVRVVIGEDGDHAGWPAMSQRCSATETLRT